MTRRMPSAWKAFQTLLQRFVPLVVAGAVLVVGIFGGHWLLPGTDHESEESSTEPAMEESTVRITLAKAEAARIHVQEVQRRDIQLSNTVPGTMDYDHGKHLEVRAPVECVVASIRVQPGQWVKAGEVLAILSSSEVGLARNTVKKCEADLQLTRKQYDWVEQTDKNLASLLALLREEPSIEQIESAFEGRVLGEHRDELITAYSEYLLATSVHDASQELRQGVLSGRTLLERQSRRQVAAASFKGLCEQSLFHSSQDLERARAAVEAAERELAISRERLSVLLGPFGQHATETGEDGGGLTQFALVAPSEGRVETLQAVASGRFQEGEIMLELADTRTLWVTAHIYQHEWASLDPRDQKVEVSIPGDTSPPRQASIRFIGPTLSRKTLALPLVAELDNGDDRFRPGMFVWVDTASTATALSVPTSAVQRVDEQPFVFVQEEELTFRRLDVTLGRSTPEWTEVTAGLKAGQLVVDQGAFYLKSELLLEEE